MSAPPAAERLRAAALWTLCAVALMSSFTAIVGSAETLSLQNMTFAQAYSGIYLLAQPAAAAVFLVALMLAGQDEPAAALLGTAARRRVVLLSLGVPAALLGAELFLAGPEGPWLPGVVWIALKGALVLAVVWLARRVFRDLAPAPRLAMAFAAVVVGLVNVGATVLRRAP